MAIISASFSGQYIHCAFCTILTLKDGNAVIFMAVDNFTKFAFNPSIVKEFNIDTAYHHLISVLHELKAQHPKKKPTFVLGFGEDFFESLVTKIDKKATLIYDPNEANRVAMPVIELMLNRISGK